MTHKNKMSLVAIALLALLALAVGVLTAGCNSVKKSQSVHRAFADSVVKYRSDSAYGLTVDSAKASTIRMITTDIKEGAKIFSTVITLDPERAKPDSDGNLYFEITNTEAYRPYKMSVPANTKAVEIYQNEKQKVAELTDLFVSDSSGYSKVDTGSLHKTMEIAVSKTEYDKQSKKVAFRWGIGAWVFIILVVVGFMVWWKYFRKGL